MQNIQFDTGIRNYVVNGDENNVIRINIADLNLPARTERAHQEILALAEEYDTEQPTPRQLEEADRRLRAGCPRCHPWSTQHSR